MVCGVNSRFKPEKKFSSGSREREQKNHVLIDNVMVISFDQKRFNKSGYSMYEK